jgi:hypothetical protein
MALLGPDPATRHANPGTYVHKDLHTCTHVFLSQDATRRAIEPIPGPVSEREDAATPYARQASHHVN